MAFRMRAPPEDLRDLGFGKVVADHQGQRLINRDGSFTVRRERLGWRGTLSLYHRLLTMRWSSFLLVLLIVFVVINALFASVFWLLGATAVSGDLSTGADGRWLQNFFMSVHTVTGVGYGNVVPNGLVPNLVMTLESFVGFVFLALTTGVVFARFSRPQAAIDFSRRGIVAPFREGSAFMFRLANRRKNELINLRASVLLSLMNDTGAVTSREFIPLSLERDEVALFPLSWTIVHAIDDDSPLAGLSLEDLQARDAEILVMVEGVDETFSQTVHARTSYKASEIVWDAKFSNVFRRSETGTPMRIDVSRIHAIERVEASD